MISGPVVAVGEVDKDGLHTGRHYKIVSLEFTRSKMLQINMKAEHPEEQYFIFNVPATLFLKRALAAETRKQQRRAKAKREQIK